MPDQLRAISSDYSMDGILQMVKENFGKIFSGVSGFLGSFTFVFIVPVYIALIMIYRDLLRNFLIMVFKNKSSAPKPETQSGKVPLSDIERLIPKIRSIVQKYIVGMFYVMCILFVLYSTALMSLGIGHAILFAALAASLNIIPYVGPFLGAGLPIVFALLTKDSLFYPIAVLGAFIVIQSVEGNLLTPKIVGNNVSLNPLITLITLFVGASIWGVVGMILFIPMVAILKEIFKSIDGLEAYAYVLGTGQNERKEPGWLSKTWSKLVKKIKN
jgi:predicted PurR-regulated permease PerM